VLAAALAVRAPRTGHVFVDLAEISATAAVETEETVDLSELPWPAPAEWTAAVAASTTLVALGDEDDAAVRPLRLIGSRVYLDRYWREERSLATVLSRLSGGGMQSVPIDGLAAALARLFPEPGDHLARAAAACAVLRGLAVIAGGPGTGKTTTVARIAALLGELAATLGEAAPLIALCAPTGKAAARLEAAVHEEARRLPVSDDVRAGLLALRASTIHRLLGWRPGSHSRFRHDAGNRLPHDVVIVDETSMVGLSLMGRLLEAVRADARVVLVGDPDQLTAIEAGAVLRDIVGPAADGVRMSVAMAALLARCGCGELPGEREPSPRSFGDGVVALQRGHRYGEAIGAVARAIRRGDGDGVLAALRAGGEVRWLELDTAEADAAALAALRDEVLASGAGVMAAAVAGDGAGALQALGGFRLLCAHRRGRYGVASWTAVVERWLAEAIDGFASAERDYVGRPLLITENDYELRLFNGDTGVVVRAGDRLAAVFERDGELVSIAPSRLGSAETVHAMTIHKSQGSQFEVAAVLLPDPTSRILTRELLYTAVTRARRRLLLIGTEASVRAAVARPVARASGLRERLWGA
jgi:exodeoxyribonuclease V alpha subunit